jgi:nitrogen fixation/metabolism regulation signal transduction histidine kinase
MDDTLPVKPEEILHLATLKEALAAFRHEVSQPLNAIIMAAQIVELRLEKSLLPDTEKAFLSQRLELISSQVRRANNILQEIRDYATKGALSAGATDLSRLLGQIRSMMAQQFMFRGIQVTAENESSTYIVKEKDVPLFEGALVQAFAFARDTVDAIESWHKDTSSSYNKNIRVSLSDSDDGSKVQLIWDPGEMPKGTIVLDPDTVPGICAAQFILQARGGVLSPQWDSMEIMFPA